MDLNREKKSVDVIAELGRILKDTTDGDRITAMDHFDLTCYQG